MFLDFNEYLYGVKVMDKPAILLVLEISLGVADVRHENCVSIEYSDMLCKSHSSGVS